MIINKEFVTQIFDGNFLNVTLCNCISWYRFSYRYPEFWIRFNWTGSCTEAVFRLITRTTGNWVLVQISFKIWKK